MLNVAASGTFPVLIYVEFTLRLGFSILRDLFPSLDRFLYLPYHVPKAHKVGMGETEVRFTTNRNTILFSSPNLSYTRNEGSEVDVENAFVLVRQDDDKLYFWMVCHDCPVAEGKLPEKDCYPSNEVKEFLSLHADAYARANEPIWTFTKKFTRFPTRHSLFEFSSRISDVIGVRI